MEQLLEILTEVNSDVDYETCDTLIDDGILDSFDIVSIVGELNDTFDIETVCAPSVYPSTYPIEKNNPAPVSTVIPSVITSSLGVIASVTS